MKPLQLALMHSNPLMLQGLRCLAGKLPFPVSVSCCFSSLEEGLKSRGVNAAEALIAELMEPAVKHAEILLWLQRNTALQTLIVMTGGEDMDLLLNLFAGRPVSLLSPREPEETSIALIAGALRGKNAVSPLILRMINPFPYAIRHQIASGLTESERRVLKWLLAGYDIAQIAGQIRRSVKTVSTHKRNIMKKLEVSNDDELFAVARYTGTDPAA
ncbi:helix-turn-helix transcriptional regulator [Enterobacillus tribolii]|uniref:DNA-binding NarL/FixJ family response regulator n=1 Tax=Enterobacillus tribolii TaxID=1487935 RepID=A0A370Q6A5_9GAMM|nr:response regulator transcription factor [Enterobacillus tribolii]MBW7984965.1 response regulator transcription factor [Enterobacillus tribolii]RDK83895.1 DNA-binding NarL/FixJ family response regulator [Enterobacillus tribolii]